MKPSGLRRCCEMDGLFYPGGTRRCHLHASETQRALRTELDKRAPAVGIRPGHRSSLGWPYGPNIDVRARQGLLEWAEPRGLRLTEAGHCLRWIRGRRCQGSCSRLPWLDHVTAWNFDRKPAVLLAQPYHLGEDDFEEFEELEEEGYVVLVGSGWYGNKTYSVEVWRFEQAELCGIEMD